MDVEEEDVKVVGVREEDAEDRVRWRQLIRSGDPYSWSKGGQGTCLFNLTVLGLGLFGSR